MEGIKCPMCKAISLEPGISDGDMIRCTCCQAKFTVTKFRRYNLVPQDVDKISSGQGQKQLLERFVRKLDNEKLMLLLELLSKEIMHRMKSQEPAERSM
ncbi:MAG: hypothetical protein JG781_423 [Peptococcaceae bacterium]|jgi:hypothetical protein|nr:hypothetical protein [Peptococcaceae bacterium]